MNKRWRWLLPLVLGTLVVLSAAVSAGHARAASDFTYNIDLNYQLSESGTVKVVSTYRVSAKRNDRILDLIRIAAPTSDIENLQANYLDGREISTNTIEKTNTNLGFTYNYKEITVDFEPGAPAAPSFVISYETKDLMDTKGSARAVYVPSLADVGSDENYTVSVSAPQSFGRLFSTGVAPELNGTDGERVRYSFARATDLKRALTLIFGESTVYQVNFNYPLQNDMGQSRTMTITLPPDTSAQKVFIRSLEPKPSSTRLDADGNILADYQVPARSKIVVKTDIAAQVKYLEYDLAKSGVMKDIPTDLARRYTSQSRYWQTTSPQLQVKASQAVAGTDKVIDKVRNLYKLTVDTLTYNNEKIQYNIRQGSDKALSNPENAVCLEYSDLLIALLRSQGIPARMPVGYAYAGNLKQSKAVSDSLHSWVEAYVPGIGWMNLDPTWGEKFDNFGKSDLDHFTFAIWGEQDAMPTAVMSSGKDMNYQYEQTELAYSSDFPASASTGSVSVRSLVLFPGVNLTRYQVKGPENIAGDNFAVQIKHGAQVVDRKIGSLAPGQNFTQNILVVGGEFAAPAEVVLTQSADGQQAVLALARADVQWWPFITICVVLSGIIALILVKLRLDKRRTAQQGRDSSAYMPQPSSPPLTTQPHQEPHHDRVQPPHQ